MSSHSLSKKQIGQLAILFTAIWAFTMLFKIGLAFDTGTPVATVTSQSYSLGWGIGVFSGCTIVIFGQNIIRGGESA